MSGKKVKVENKRLVYSSTTKADLNMNSMNCFKKNKLKQHTDFTYII